MNIRSMDCISASEALPWYLNGTLDADETRSLEAHLKSCGQCRQEHRDVAFAAAVYAAHPAAEDLVDFAFHRLTLSPRRAIVERHLKACAECAEEVRLVEESRDTLAELEAAGADEPPRTPSQSIPIVREMRPRKTATAAFWRNAALAASLAAVLGAGLWLWNVGSRPVDLAQNPEAAEGGDARAGFGPSLPQLPSASSAGGSIVSVEPGNLTYGANAISPSTLELSSAAQELHITLRLPEVEGQATLELQVLDAGDRVVWRGGVLEAIGDGLFEATLPLEFMPSGAVSLRVRQRIDDRGETLATLPIELVRR